MSVSSQFSSVEEYLNSALTFLKTHQWIYNYNNTHILENQVLLKIPTEWIVYFRNLSSEELHDLVLGQVKESAPFQLKTFIGEIYHLKPQIFHEVLYQENQFSQNSGLSRKKIHEILSLAPVIHEACKEVQCDLIVDIGSGLGYLPHFLHEKYGYSVLGLEVSKEFIKLAYKNQDKHYRHCKNSVKFCELNISENSCSEIEQAIIHHFGHRQNICITGLHACADLSIVILNLFMQIKSAKGLAVMPCCYHRIEVAMEAEGKIWFKNLPSSRLLRELFKKFDAYNFIRKPFLRLACQQTIGSFIRMTEAEHIKHSNQCMYRAVLQLVTNAENCSVRRLIRKSGKSNATDSDEGFLAYLNNLGNTHKLEFSEPTTKNQIRITDEAFLSKMHEKWNEYKGDCCLIEVLMGLQAAIQSICENVILLDRVEFLKEKGFHCYVRKITNDLISPRCWVQIAVKPS